MGKKSKRRPASKTTTLAAMTGASAASSETLVMVKIEYIEATFTIGVNCYQEEDLMSSLLPAAKFALAHGKKILSVEMKAVLCGLLVKENGVPYTLAEWADQFFVGLLVKDKDTSLLAELNRERKFKEELLQKGIIELTGHEKSGKEGSGTKQPNASHENPRTMTELLNVMRGEMDVVKTRLAETEAKLSTQEAEIQVLRSVMTPIEGIYVRKLLEQFRRKVAALVSDQLPVRFQEVGILTCRS
ncbi:uncharacterized protein LOC9633528 [Selaginella moellendorffii]|uniref:uncharacterized protein LOC9633528 n=1 Tax=Selaginella moellendorffii TaxID=88036 RepID=UPI000D1CF83A|nr:uncharacterized protein LOC9633528 [Selaginella moellendorffii]|eukprot:XP_024539308.1 uncharacterized protein LOC9633528 [Selaginella moellendorffii]